MNQPKYGIGQTVYKHTGNYGGPGIVRGIANDTGQPLRYLVGHAIAGGYGEFYHVYAEGNLRAVDGVTGTIGLQCPGAAGVPAPETELLDALVEAHRQVDYLMAQIILRDRTFMPSQSPLWPEIVRRAKLLQKHRAIV